MAGLPSHAVRRARLAMSLGGLAGAASAANKQLLDLLPAHAVEIGRNPDPSFEKPDPLPTPCFGGIHGNHLDQRFDRFGDDERLAPCGPFDQARQIGLYFMDAYGARVDMVLAKSNGLSPRTIRCA